METLYKYLLCYYVFVKKSKKKWPSLKTLESVSEICLFVNLLLISFVLELIFGFEGVLHLTSRGIPLAPIGIVVGIVMYTFAFIVFSKVKGKREFSRYAITKANNIKRVYAILYLVFSGLAFLSIILIGIVVRISEGLS